jgi:NAD(P)-dependent dehydrogenase (short-subunit alcohol dehydrogenase family)
VECSRAPLQQQVPRFDPVNSRKGQQMSAERAAIVTGASSGIGLAIARVLGEEGFGLTVAARRPEKLEAAAEDLADEGLAVQAIAANVADEAEIQKVVAAHRDRYGRLDVLVNNAGVGVGAPVAEIATKRVDMQLDINLRSIILFYRECMPMLREAAGEHKSVLVVNTSSISGKHGEAWLSVYSATKHGVVGWTEAMNKEIGAEGIKSTALCPAFVDTPMTDFVKEHVPAEEMIRPEDIAESVRFLLRVSPACVVPEIMFVRPGEAL